MLDCHCHILPNMDDGAKDSNVSRLLLCEEAKQGVHAICATPHYYPGNETVESFLKRRKAAFLEISGLTTQKGISAVYLGAEVYVTPDIIYLDGLSDLCLQNTSYLLLEPPYEEWGDWLYHTIYLLEAQKGLKPIIAHLERYVSGKKSMCAAMRLVEMGVGIQINAASCVSFGKQRIVKRLTEQAACCYLGSDAHNMDMRPPLLEKAYQWLEKKAPGGLEKIIKSQNCLENELRGK